MVLLVPSFDYNSLIPLSVCLQECWEIVRTSVFDKPFNTDFIIKQIVCITKMDVCMEGCDGRVRFRSEDFLLLIEDHHPYPLGKR